MVDDDASMRRALRTQLQVAGFNVLIFQSGEEVLASEFPYDNTCLLLDVWMPRMNALQVCRDLAATGRQVPTILMSGLDDERTTQIMRTAGPIARLFKPFEEKQLMRAVRKALKRALN